MITISSDDDVDLIDQILEEIYCEKANDQLINDLISLRKYIIHGKNKGDITSHKITIILTLQAHGIYRRRMSK